MGVEKQKLQEYAVVEMMGHRKIVGKITESDIGLSSLLRVDVLNREGGFDRTEYIGQGSIYCLTIVTEEAAKAAAANNSPAPTWAWNIPQRPALTDGNYIEADRDEYDDDFDDL
ncbi:MAG TPA: hypothetical protein VIL74_08785 [Pyrinomonadaceae bacterium]|jgi:hypothetical protein